MSNIFRIGSLSCALAMIATGCSDEPSTEFRRSQVMAYENAVESYESKDFDEAEKQLTIALTETTLHIDQLETAFLMRARVRIELDRLDEAAEDLDLLEQGAANMDDVWIVRGELYQKQGDADAAKLAFQEAKKINPKAAVPGTN